MCASAAVCYRNVKGLIVPMGITGAVCITADIITPDLVLPVYNSYMNKRYDSELPMNHREKRCIIFPKRYCEVLWVFCE